MAEHRPPRLAYRFVPPGTPAPVPILASEVWIDVGDRTEGAVLDHHGGGAGAGSATELAFRDGEEVLRHVGEHSNVTLVLHQAPDFDAVVAAWVVRNTLLAGRSLDASPGLAALVTAVSEHDQGIIRTNDPRTSLALIVTLLLRVDFHDWPDAEKVAAAMERLDVAGEILASGGGLTDAAAAIRSAAVEDALASAEGLYRVDVQRGVSAELWLPTRGLDVEGLSETSTPAYPPSASSGGWAPADALLLRDPQSPLFKEFARTDRARSPQVHGFALLVVCAAVVPNDQFYRRWTISTDPLSGFHLQGLGPLLEQLEERQEQTMGEVLPRRKRVALGTGRHGYNVMSPWYDGRGHHFTIVDSPMVELDGRPVIASCLAERNIMEALVRYGAEARSRGAAGT